MGCGGAADRGGEEVVEHEQVTGGEVVEETQLLGIGVPEDGQPVGEVVEAVVAGGVVASAGGLTSACAR